jgi:hypothetical protein
MWATKAVRREDFFSAMLGHEDEKARRFFLSKVLDVLCDMKYGCGRFLGYGIFMSCVKIKLTVQLNKIISKFE